MLFVVGSPRSGTTMLERILSAHSMIQGGPEPHLLTPLAHLGVWDKVDKAPYDHVLAAQAQRGFVDCLPGGLDDYWDACRAYCDILYGRYLAPTGKPVCLDKTPADALILPFLMKVFPDAKYVVLTRHPLATFSSFANSFFDGDYEAANRYNPLLERYVPAIAAFLRQKEVPRFHVRYEDFVKDPEALIAPIYEYIGVPCELETVNYGDKEDQATRQGLGDPIGVEKHSRPTTRSVSKWVSELAHDSAKLDLMRRIVDRLDPADLAELGYPLEELWKPLEEAGDEITPPSKPRLTRYRLQRKMIVKFRTLTQRNRLLHKLVSTARLACDVLLRE